MDYEKKYKNALEWARQVMNGETGFIRKEVEEVFTELKESEDERIRKDIIRCLKYSGIQPDRPINPHVRTTMKDALAWLEKQGEQKPIIEMKSAEESLGIDSETYNKIVDECIYGNAEQKSAWSEEDEEMLNSIIARLQSHPNVGLEEYSKEYSWLIYTLKSLKKRYTWKPSDEQMEVLNEVLNFAANHEDFHWNDYIFDTLNNLIRQLQKLKE